MTRTAPALAETESFVSRISEDNRICADIHLAADNQLSAADSWFVADDSGLNSVKLTDAEGLPEPQSILPEDDRREILVADDTILIRAEEQDDFDRQDAVLSTTGQQDDILATTGSDLQYRKETDENGRILDIQSRRRLVKGGVAVEAGGLKEVREGAIQDLELIKD